MNNWLTLSKEEQVELFTQVGVRMNLPPQAIEKDAWVTLMLRMIFNSKVASQFIFKGGTSLSKAFNLIQRFSEDIDLSIDRSYLGFEGELTKGEIRKLRRACHTFVAEKLTVILTNELHNYGVDSGLYDLVVENEKISDQDPETIQVNYQSVFEEVSYLPKRVLIEVSARSLREPYQEVKINSFIDQQYPKMDFVEPMFEVQATNPQKTFLEKLILLHEEFEKPADKIRHLRMSRHFYDIGQILNSEYGLDALQDSKLFTSIIEHRKVLTPVKTTDYETLGLKTLNITPPEGQMKNFKSDYRDMQGSMIHGSSENFDVLLEKINNSLKLTLNDKH